MENRENFEGDIKIESPFLKKLDNYWYHYKWHTIVGIVVVIILSVLLFQTCSKQDYDGYILYAGPYKISSSAENGNTSSYSNTISALKKVCYDTNNDKNVNVTLLNLYISTQEEATKLYGDGVDISNSSMLIDEDSDRLGQTLLYGDYYVCFLSERLFLHYEELYEGALFTSVSDYLGEGDYELASEHGVYLKSLDFYSLPEICNLPDDTVVCLRKSSDVSNFFNRRQNEKNFEISEKIFKNILNFKK